jgi:hypothetical protein
MSTTNPQTTVDPAPAVDHAHASVLELLTRTEAERDARLRPLRRMTPTERVTAMRRGELTIEQCCAWASRNPGQVPLINGEFEFIAAYTPEVCE